MLTNSTYKTNIKILIRRISVFLQLLLSLDTVNTWKNHA
jgi:hypothetical protein